MRDSLLVYADKMEPRTVGDIESDVIDFGGKETDYGKTDGHNFFQVRATSAFAGGGSLKVELHHSDDGVSFVKAVGSEEIADTALTAGKMVICQSIPVGFKRYSKVVATVSGANMSGGAITAWIGTREEA